MTIKEQNMKFGANKFVVCLFCICMAAAATPRQAFGAPLPRAGKAQQTPEKTVTLNVTQRTLVYILSQIKEQTGLAYGFKNPNDQSRNELYSINVRKVSVDSALNTLFKGTKFTYEIVGNLILITEGQAVDSKVSANLIKVKGKITDEDGNPIPGATILIHGTTQGVASNVEGLYELQANPDDILQVSFIGYDTEIVPIRGQSEINIAMKFTAEDLEEVSVVAFGTQKKESVVSAITTVRPMDLKTSSSDLTTSLAGRVAGIIGWQTGGIPGTLTEEEMNTKFYIRGVTSFQEGANTQPLVLIDGVESSVLDLSRIAVEDIETFSVLKDASATAMYGARGANGVLMVTTKKGEEGSVYTSVRYEAIISMPTKDIDVVDPVTWMRMYNEASLNRTPGITPKYSAETIERTLSGKYPDFVYPQNDWYGMMFKNFNVNHHAGVSIRGGSKVMQYYASLNYNHDSGMLKTDKLNDFDCNIKNNALSFRTNLNIDLKAGIKLLITSATNMDKYHGPFTDMSQAYGLAFTASPVDFAAMYPADDTYSWPHLRFGGENENSNNPYMLLQKGYIERTRFSTTNRAEYIQNLSSLVKGLEFRASISLAQTSYYTAGFATQPFMYALENYDFETGKHILRALNEKNASRTLQFVNTGGNTNSTQVTYEARLQHTAGWKDHQTSLIGVFQMLESTGTASTFFDALPARNMTFSMRGSYGYKDRYFVEGSFGYNGSERFAKKNRMGFFPAVGAAWVLSDEPFMESARAFWLPYFKLRLSYGKVGNDGIINSPRFVFIPQIDRLQSTIRDPEPFGGNISPFQITAYENENIEWEVAEQVNLGMEAKMFDGILEFNLDFFQEVRHNILANRTVLPSSMGIQIDPLDNIGKARTRGLEFSGKIQHAFDKDFWVILNATATYSQSKYLEIEEATNKPNWQVKVGHEISQQVGYIAEGLFRDQAEIDNAPVQGGDVMPGDIRYRDLNGDHVIDVEDATYIGYPETPRLIYGLQGYLTYKNWEFNFAFQGSGKRSFFMNPSAISPFVNNHAMLKAIYDDHWSEENMAHKPFWPRLSTYNITQHNPQEDWYNNTETRKSTYFMRECRFLRCTSLELAYNMPKKLMNKWKMSNLKFFVRANNPFVITNFKVWDVELGEDGFNYPIQKTFTAGLNFSF